MRIGFIGTGNMKRASGLGWRVKHILHFDQARSPTTAHDIELASVPSACFSDRGGRLTRTRIVSGTMFKTLDGGLPGHMRIEAPKLPPANRGANILEQLRRRRAGGPSKRLEG